MLDKISELVSPIFFFSEVSHFINLAIAKLDGKRRNSEKFRFDDTSINQDYH